MFSHHRRWHTRSTDRFAQCGQLSSMMQQGSDLDGDDSDRELSIRISEVSGSEVGSPTTGDPTSSSQKLRDELKAMSREFKTLKREYMVKSETLKRAIELLEKDE